MYVTFLCVSCVQNEIHYFSIVNSLMITLFLTGVVAMIMLRTLRKDISAYNEVGVPLRCVLGRDDVLYLLLLNIYTFDHNCL